MEIKGKVLTLFPVKEGVGRHRALRGSPVSL